MSTTAELEFYGAVPKVPALEQFEDIRRGKLVACETFFNLLQDKSKTEPGGESIVIDQYAESPSGSALPDHVSIYINNNNKGAGKTVSSIKQLLSSSSADLNFLVLFWQRLRRDLGFTIFTYNTGDLYYCVNAYNSSGLKFRIGDVIEVSDVDLREGKLLFNHNTYNIHLFEAIKNFGKMKIDKGPKIFCYPGDVFRVKKDIVYDGFEYKQKQLFKIVPKQVGKDAERWFGYHPQSSIYSTCNNRVVKEEELKAVDIYRLSNGHFLHIDTLVEIFEKLKPYDDAAEVYINNLKKYKVEDTEKEIKSINEEDVEIATLIEAGYPLINIISYEEDRVLKVLERIAKEKSYRVVTWSVISGFNVKMSGKEDKLKDPLDALNYILSFGMKGKTIFVLKDFHKYLGQFSPAQVIRSLRDIAQSENSTIILLSPVQEVPIELKKDVIVVNYTLPQIKDLEKVIKELGEKRENLIISKKDAHELAKITAGLTLNEAKKIVTKALISNDNKLDENIKAQILEDKVKTVKASGLLDYMKTDITFDDIGGLDILKDWLVKRSKDFTEEAVKYKLPHPKGLLLLGIPGCGKSLLCKALGNFWKMPVLKLDVGNIFGSLQGQSEANMREVITTVNALGRCILFIDEVEKGFSGVSSSNYCDAGTTAKVFATFLTWMQDKKNSFLICTANDIEQLHPAFLRKGRFDEVFFVDLPDKAERKKIFEIHIKRVERDPANYSIDSCAEKTKGYTGSEIEHIINEAMHEAFHKGREFTDGDVLNAIPNVTPLYTAMKDQVEKIRKWRHGRARLASIRHEKEKEVKKNG